jgi:tetratricopeptide (TPR) repeat protein
MRIPTFGSFGSFGPFGSFLLVVIFVTGCAGGDSPIRESLRPIPLPDLSQMEPSVREQLQAQHASAERARAKVAVPLADLASEFGNLGRLLLAAELPAAAEPCFINAQVLGGGDMRWPYYLGHVYRTRGELTRAVSAFERALELQPADVSSLIWLGRVNLDLSRPEAAEGQFARALALSPAAAAAQVGLGRAALERKDYARAVRELEVALRSAPQASSVHYPLALAYRGMGDQARADAHMLQRGSLEVPLPDPLMDELGSLLESPLAYQRRGLEALGRGAWDEAVANFRRGLELKPTVPSLRNSLNNKLGAALFQMGDLAGARQQFQHGIRESPTYGANHVSLAILLVTEGRDVEAIKWLRAAVQTDPSYLEAHIQLADALRRTGSPGEALDEYMQAIRLDSRASDASFGAAMALVRLNRYREALAQLIDGQKRHPTERRFTHAIARLLAAAPDGAVRDGARALTLAQELQATGLSVELAETLAMASAEVGRFRDAVEWQRQVIAAVRENGGEQSRLEALVATLARYERGEPIRTPWSQDDAVHYPRPRLR